MKTNFQSTFFIALFAILINISCTTNVSSVTSTPLGPNDGIGFNWTENSGSNVLTANNPFAEEATKSIIVIRATTIVMQMNLTSLAVGTYPLGAGSSNSFVYNNKGTGADYVPTSGNIVINKIINNKISGTFSALKSGNNGLTNVSGTFTNLTIK